jgi:hypothetical protein
VAEEVILEALEAWKEVAILNKICFWIVGDYDHFFDLALERASEMSCMTSVDVWI